MGQRSITKNYECRIEVVKRTVTRADGSTVVREKTKHRIPYSELPETAQRAMYTSAPPRPIYHLRNSPLSKDRKKRIRPAQKYLFNKEAVALIKAGKIKEVINPITRRIPRHFLTSVKHFHNAYK